LPEKAQLKEERTFFPFFSQYLTDIVIGNAILTQLQGDSSLLNSVLAGGTMD